jgi:hypothetical protein
MTPRRLMIAVAAILLLAGVIGLLVPVSVSDNNGGSISCGNGVAADLSAARSANEKNGANIPVLNQVIPHNDYVAQCQSSVTGRRAWTIPLAIVGLIGVGAPLLLVRRSGTTRTGV